MPQGYCIKKHGPKVDFSVEKQRMYMELLPTDLSVLFGAPKIIYSADDYVVMDFINGYGILDVINKDSVEQLDRCVDCLIRLIKWELSESIDVMMTEELVHYKFGGDIVEKGAIVPYGPCHGDLTLSNIIFNNKIYLIDFNPNFLESPLWDIAKILQEVNLQWSFLLNLQNDATKINIAYEYLRERFVKEFQQLDVEWELIEYFYYMTLNRLLPYVTSESIQTIILEEIKKCKL